MNILNEIPIMKFLVPFMRTAGNVVSRGGGLAPTAPVIALADTIASAFRTGGLKNLDPNNPLRYIHTQTLRDLASPDPQVVMRTRGRLVAAAGIGAGVVMLHKNERITGSGPTDPSLRSAWLVDHQPYSVKVGDTWHSYRTWTGEVGLILGLWANMLDASNDGWYEDDQELYVRVLLATLNTIKDQSMLTGISNFFGAMDAATGGKGEKFITDMAWSFMPIWGQGQQALEKAKDPVLKDTVGFVQELVERTPFLDNDDLPWRYNILGEPIVRNGFDKNGEPATGGRSWYNFIASNKLKTDGDDPIFDFLMEIDYSPGKTNHLFYGLDLKRIPSPSGVRTVWDDYNHFVNNLTGDVPTLRESLMELINTEAYQNLSNLSVEGLSPKAMYINRIVSLYREKAKGLLLASNPELLSMVEGQLTAEQLSMFVGSDMEQPGQREELDKILSDLKEFKP
jgi:hypothetical protein